MSKTFAIPADDVARIVAEAIQDAILGEQARLVANMNRRIADLRICHKKDYCQEMADCLDGYIQEFLDGSNQ